MGYLDRDGLAYLWNKVKKYVDERLGGGEDPVAREMAIRAMNDVAQVMTDVQNIASSGFIPAFFTNYDKLFSILLPQGIKVLADQGFVFLSPLFGIYQPAYISRGLEHAEPEVISTGFGTFTIFCKGTPIMPIQTSFTMDFTNQTATVHISDIKGISQINEYYLDETNLVPTGDRTTGEIITFYVNYHVVIKRNDRDQNVLT